MPTIKTIMKHTVIWWEEFIEELKAILYIGEKDSCDNSVTYVCHMLDDTYGGSWGYNTDKDLYEDYLTDRTINPEEV